MEITRGKIIRPQRVVIYGPEGIGKSTFGSQFPVPLFIDVEGSTAQLDVHRTETPKSFSMLQKILTEFKKNTGSYKTLAIDTADWTERLLIQDLCARNNMSFLGGRDDYGKSYNMLEDGWAKFLDSLTEISMSCGVHIVIIAHAQMRKFEQPEEAGAFDRWELKLQKKTSALLKEWPDMLLFANYKTFVVDIKGTKKAQGGERILRTTHHPCWDAKNRHGLPDEFPFKFDSIAHIFNSNQGSQKQQPQPVPQPQPVQEPMFNETLETLFNRTMARLERTYPAGARPWAQKHSQAAYARFSEAEAVLEATWAKVRDRTEPISRFDAALGSFEAALAEMVKEYQKEHEKPQTERGPEQPGVSRPIPANLQQLMSASNVSEADVRAAVAKRGYYPIETPIINYDTTFVDGVLVAKWSAVCQVIEEIRKETA